jgi:molybdopterin-containing oxidoreductase family iron-sulfur binding subunit
MKTIPPACPEPEAGRTYWRSLDQLADKPEFRQWMEREFPEGASELTDPVSRRHFVKIMSASFLLAGLGLGATGCRRPQQKILPFSKTPENYVHGVPEYYATSMPTRGGAVPLVVKSHEGRPVKIEGNSLHPDSNGGSDRFAQASILNLYDPDRAISIKQNGNVRSVEETTDALSVLARQTAESGGAGLCLLLEQSSSPSRDRLQEMLSLRLPKARWFMDEAVDLSTSARAASIAFGKGVKPLFRYEKADVILSLDCDFIGSEEDVHNNIRKFSVRRKVEKGGEGLNRLYAVESLMTLTGVSADHRLRISSTAVAQVAGAIAAQVLGGDAPAGLASLGKPAGVDEKWILECSRDLLAHKGKCLVVAGYRQPLAVHLLAFAINSALGNVGETVVLLDSSSPKCGSLADLAGALNAGEVQTLVILGGNPVFTAPADLGFATAMAKAKQIIRLGYYEDETFAKCNWHLPAAHYLESWGDARATDGSLLPVQPLISPLFGGMTELEVLARVGGLAVTSPYEIVRQTFGGIVGSGDFEGAWKRLLHDGFLANSAGKPVSASFQGAALTGAIAGLKLQLPTKDRLEVVFHRDYSLDDGRYANNGWLQEMPDPITKMVWDNAVLVSRKTAQELGVKNGEVVEIKVGGRSILGPIWVQPGSADYSLGLALGYGRERTGRVGQKAGFNAYALRAGTDSIVVGATVAATGKTYTIACTQDHWSMEGRPIVREANLNQYRAHPDFAKRLQLPEPEGSGSLYPNPFDKLKETGHHQWGMSIDLNLCVGCSSCMVACQSENNIPIVGKDQVKRGREMHWIRIDRYFSGIPSKRKFADTYHAESQQQFEEWVDDPQAVTQPMLCQHCEAATCESVCPVNATIHDQEGLNLMVYNRCVGTRYCSNNCPYKVRRFNYFDYNKRPLDALYKGPFGQRKDDEWDLIKMIKNPDVTVRMRGVMEKCTFCIQRIEQAKIAQKVKAGSSSDVTVPDGTFTTACAQACPAGAILFGNVADPESRVSKAKESERDYTVLDFLNTRPRITYLARVRNPNPAMPDYQEAPLSFQYYEQKMGDPFIHGAKPHEAGHGHIEGHMEQKGAH